MKKRTKGGRHESRSRVRHRRTDGGMKEKEWTVNEFVDTVWKTMEEQAERNNALKMVHARLEPEWNKVVQAVSQMLEANAESDITRYTEEICRYGERAVRPLIDIILKLRSAVNFMNGPKDQEHPNE